MLASRVCWPCKPTTKPITTTQTKIQGLKPVDGRPSIQGKKKQTRETAKETNKKGKRKKTTLRAGKKIKQTEISYNNFDGTLYLTSNIKLILVLESTG